MPSIRYRPGALPAAVAAFLAVAACAGAPPLPAPPDAPPALDPAGGQGAPGVSHRSIRDPEGPWSIEVLEVDPRACGVAIRTGKAEGRLVGRLPTTRIAARLAEESDRPSLGAVNADFFTFDPDGVPAELQVAAGEMVRGPSGRHVFGMVGDTLPFIGRVEMRAAARVPDTVGVPVGAVNTPAADTVTILLNRFASPEVFEAGRRATLLRWLSEPVRVGRPARSVVVGTAAPIPTAIDPGSAALLLAGRERGRMALGDTLTVRIDLAGAPGDVTEAVGGLPRLLAEGRAVHAEAELSEAFAGARHPRTAVGWRPDGTLLLVTVDGRQPGRSEGMSLAELADLFLELGTSDALNLDGGGSTTMVVAGRVENRPSDPTGERPVANALVVLGPKPGECDRTEN